MNNQENSQVSVLQYDPHIIPAESAARQQREGKHFLTISSSDSIDNSFWSSS